MAEKDLSLQGNGEHQEGNIVKPNRFELIPEGNRKLSGLVISREEKEWLFFNSEIGIYVVKVTANGALLGLRDIKTKEGEAHPIDKDVAYRIGGTEYYFEAGGVSGLPGRLSFHIDAPRDVLISRGEWIKRRKQG